MSQTSPPSKVQSIKRVEIGVNVVIQTILVLLILGVANFAGFHYYKRWDVSRDQTRQLSDKTLQVLKSLPDGIKIYALSSRRDPLGPEIDNLLKDLRFASDKKIEVISIDSYVELERVTELQKNYKFDENSGVVIIVNKDKYKNIYPGDAYEFDNSGQMYGQPPRVVAFKGEQSVAAALIEITESQQRKIYAVEGHGEYNLLGSEKYFALKRIIETESIKFEKLRLSDSSEVPADASALLIAGARFDFSEREIEMLEAYWRKRGRFMILLDPDSSTPLLNEFIGRTGIKVENNRVIGRRASTEVKDLIILERNVFASFVGGSPITKNILTVVAALPSPVQSLEINEQLAKAQQINVVPLLMTTTGYWGEVDFTAKDDQIQFDQGVDAQGPLILIAQAEKGAVGDQRVQLDSSRIIVAGNALLADSRVLEAQAAVTQFMIGSFNWLTDREELIGVPPKEMKLVKINIPGQRVGEIFNIVVILIPFAALLLGIAVWWRRRN